MTVIKGTKAKWQESFYNGGRKEVLPDVLWLLLLLWVRVSHSQGWPPIQYVTGWPRTPDPPVSTSHMLKYQVCATKLSLGSWGLPRFHIFFRSSWHWLSLTCWPQRLDLPWGKAERYSGQACSEEQDRTLYGKLLCLTVFSWVQMNIVVCKLLMPLAVSKYSYLSETHGAL